MFPNGPSFVVFQVSIMLMSTGPLTLTRTRGGDKGEQDKPYRS